MDPRIEIPASDSGPAVERGVGNQVSVEFNLLYRFHAAVSKRDDKWTAEFFQGIFGDKKPEAIDLEEFYKGVVRWERGIPKEPSERVFGGLTRDPKTGKFDDGGLVKILKESIEDPAGRLSQDDTLKAFTNELLSRRFWCQKYPQAFENS